MNFMLTYSHCVVNSNKEIWSALRILVVMCVCVCVSCLVPVFVVKRKINYMRCRWTKKKDEEKKWNKRYLSAISCLRFVRCFAFSLLVMNSTLHTSQPLHMSKIWNHSAGKDYRAMPQIPLPNKAIGDFHSFRIFCISNCVVGWK